MSAESKLLVGYLKAVVASGQPSFTRDRVTIQGQRRVWESILVPGPQRPGDRSDRVAGLVRDVTSGRRAGGSCAAPAHGGRGASDRRRRPRLQQPAAGDPGQSGNCWPAW